MPFFVQSLEDWEQAGTPGLLSVLIPAHNEEAVIAGTVESFHAVLVAAGVPHEILLINDNSNDRTDAILCQLEQRVPTLRHLHNEPPNGFGFAVRRGLAEFRGACVALVMSDASDDPKDLVAF
jgi:dolichol-phosphate mannosyltransferase